MQITEPAVFVREDCPNCGVIHFVPKDLQERARRDGRSFYCPNGHSASYTQSELAQTKKRAEQLAAELAAEKKRKEWAENATRQQTERADKAEAETQRIKKRVHAGVCPCCKRSFQNLARHMKTKHAETVRS